MTTFKTVDNYLIESGYNLFYGEYKYYIDTTSWRIIWGWTAKTGYTKMNKAILKK